MVFCYKRLNKLSQMLILKSIFFQQAMVKLKEYKQYSTLFWILKWDKYDMPYYTFKSGRKHIK